MNTDFNVLSDQALLVYAETYMDALMQASTQKDFAVHVSNFSKRLKAMMSPEWFEQIVTEYQSKKGYFADRQRVAYFRRPDGFAVIWRQTFTQVQGDYVAELLLKPEDGDIVVDHVMVF